MTMKLTEKFIELGIKFKTENAFNAGFAALRGNAFSFDNYKSEKTLKFFTTEVRDNAVLHLKTILSESVDFDLVELI
jgi:hypothetical protein